MLASLFVCHSKMETPTGPKWSVFYLAANEFVPFGSPCCQLTAALVTKSMGTLQASTSDALLTPGQQGFHKMTPWHIMTSMTFPWLVFGGKGPWLMVGDMYFSWYDPYHPWSSGFFPRPHCWNSVLIEAARAVRKKRFLFIFTLRCHAAIALEFPHVFFWAGPQSQWSYAKSLVWWVWTFKLAKMQISWTPKQHWTQFSVRLLATQSVSKFSCQVLIQNKLYIACIYIHNHIYTILHTHRACYVSSQVAKNPSAWWVICGVLQAEDAMFSTEDSRAAADVTTWARPKPGRGDISSGGLDEPVEFIGMSLKEFECVIFVGTCVGRFGGTQRTT